MLNEEEWALVWFDYHDYNFAKVEQILKKFNQISDIFDKNLIKNAIFDKNMFPDLKEQLLNLDYEKFAVDLYLFAEGRDLLSELNCNVKVLEDSPYFSDVFNKSVGDSVITLLKKKKIGLALYRVIRFMKARLKIKNFSTIWQGF